MINKSLKSQTDIIANPKVRFETPTEVVNDKHLSDATKKRVLDAWEEDARRLAVATEEGMSGGEASQMAEVAEAKASLGITNKRRPSPTKTG